MVVYLEVCQTQNLGVKKGKKKHLVEIKNNSIHTGIEKKNTRDNPTPINGQ